MDNTWILDKAQGALIGSALGDAIGIYTGEPRTGMRPLRFTVEFKHCDDIRISDIVNPQNS